MRLGLTALLLATLARAASAAVLADLRLAPTVPLSEPDFLTVLREGLSEAERLGLTDEARRRAADGFRAHARRPAGPALPPAEADLERRLILLPEEDLARLDGSVGPALHGLRRVYLFADLADRRQRAWVRRELRSEPTARVVALGGDLRAVTAPGLPESLAGIRLWADQGGVLSRRLGLTALPAMVRIEGVSALIRQVRLDATEGDDD